METIIVSTVSNIRNAVPDVKGAENFLQENEPVGTAGRQRQRKRNVGGGETRLNHPDLSACVAGYNDAFVLAGLIAVPGIIEPQELFEMFCGNR
jgi:hypothetical protein